MKVIYTVKELEALLDLTTRGFSLAGKTYPVQNFAEFRAHLLDDGWQFIASAEGEVAVFELPEQKTLALFDVLGKYLKPIVTACVAIQSMAELLIAQFEQLGQELKNLR